MSVIRLSTYLEDFLAMRRVRADLDKRGGRGRHQLRYTERLLSASSSGPPSRAGRPRVSVPGTRLRAGY